MDERLRSQPNENFYETVTPGSEEESSMPDATPENTNTANPETQSSLEEDLKGLIAKLHKSLDAVDAQRDALDERAKKLDDEKRAYEEKIQSLIEKVDALTNRVNELSSDSGVAQDTSIESEAAETIAESSVDEAKDISVPAEVRKDPENDEEASGPLEHETAISIPEESNEEQQVEQAQERAQDKEEMSGLVEQPAADNKPASTPETTAVTGQERVLMEKEKTLEDFKDITATEADRVRVLAEKEHVVESFEKDNEIQLDDKESERLSAMRKKLRQEHGAVIKTLTWISNVSALRLNKRYSKNQLAEKTQEARTKQQEYNRKIADMDDRQLKEYITRCLEAASLYDEVKKEERAEYGDGAYEAALRLYGTDPRGKLAVRDSTATVYDFKTEVGRDGQPVEVRTGDGHEITVTREQKLRALHKVMTPEECADDVQRGLIIAANKTSEQIAQLNAKRGEGFGFSQEARKSAAEKLRSDRHELLGAIGARFREEQPEMTREQFESEADALTMALWNVEALKTAEALENTPTGKVSNWLKGNGNRGKAIIRQGSIGLAMGGTAAVSGASLIAVATGALTGAVAPVALPVFATIMTAKTAKEYLSASQRTAFNVNVDQALQAAKESGTTLDEQLATNQETSINRRVEDNRKDVGRAGAVAAARTVTMGLAGATVIGVASEVGHAVSDVFSSDAHATASHIGEHNTADNHGHEAGADADASSVETDNGIAKIDYAKSGYVRYDENGKADFSYKYNPYAFDEPRPEGATPEENLADQLADGRTNPEQAATMYNLLSSEQKADLGIQDMHENVQDLAEKLHDNDFRDKYMDAIEDNKLPVRTDTLPKGTYYNYGLEPVLDESGKVAGTRLVSEVHNLQDEEVTIIGTPDGNEEIWLNRCGNKLESTPPVNIPPASPITGSEVPAKVSIEKTDTEKTSVEKTDTEKTSVEKTNTEKTDAEKTDVEITPKDPTKDINVNPDLPEQVQMGEDRAAEGVYNPDYTTPPDAYTPPVPSPSPEPAPEATPVAPEVRQEEIQVAPEASGANGTVDQGIQDELKESGAGGLETNDQGTPIGNDGRVEG